MDQTIEQPALELKGVGVMRGGNWILHDINWSVPKGAAAAILGPNGSGKSTLARILTGYIWPTAGTVRIGTHQFGETDINELRRSIRLVQTAGPYDVDPELTAIQVVLTGLFGTIGLFKEVTTEQQDRAAALLRSVGLLGVRDHRYSTLSSGERVRALIARALIIRPTLLLLDEPTAGLDLRAREQVLATVHGLMTEPAHATTTLMITHHIDELGPLISNVLLLSEGTIAAKGSMDEVLTQERLSAVFRCPLKVAKEGNRRYVRVDPSAWNGLLE